MPSPSSQEHNSVSFATFFLPLRNVTPHIKIYVNRGVRNKPFLQVTSTLSFKSLEILHCSMLLTALWFASFLVFDHLHNKKFPFSIRIISISIWSSILLRVVSDWETSWWFNLCNVFLIYLIFKRLTNTKIRNLNLINRKQQEEMETEGWIFYKITGL